MPGNKNPSSGNKNLQQPGRQNSPAGRTARQADEAGPDRARQTRAGQLLAEEVVALNDVVTRRAGANSRDAGARELFDRLDIGARVRG